MNEDHTTKIIPLFSDQESGDHYLYDDMNKHWKDEPNYFNINSAKHCSYEVRDVNYKNNYKIAFIKNSIPVYARLWHDQISNDYGLFYDSSAFTDEKGTLQIEINCPKIAWGITVYILYSSIYKEKFGLCSARDASIFTPNIYFELYYDICLRSHKNAQRDEYNFYRNEEDEINRLNITFARQHLEKERKLLSDTNEMWQQNIDNSRMAEYGQTITEHIENAMRISGDYFA